MQHICVVFGNPLLASTNIKQCRDQLPFSGDVKAERGCLTTKVRQSLFYTQNLKI